MCGSPPGVPIAATTCEFIDIVQGRWRRRGYQIDPFLADNGGEFIGKRFTNRLGQLGIKHRRNRARSPNHNAVVECFHQTMPQECCRPAFHRRRFTSLHQLQAQANAWLVGY